MNSDNQTGQSAAVALEPLRREIDAIDEQLVNLLAERRQRVQKVIALKQAKNLPVYHPSREEDLISKRREQASLAGLDPDHVEELFRSVLRQSRVKQTAQIIRTGVRAGAKVLVVGGAGKMGGYFSRWFAQSGYQVRILEVDDWPNAAALCRDIDLAFISVPIPQTPAIIQRLAPFLPPQCVLADITSIKQAPVDAMLASHPGPVLGLHPLFGPMTSNMDKQIVMAVPGRDPAASQWLVDQFSSWGSIVEVLSAVEHDEIMSIVQALRHFATFAFGQFLYRRQINMARTLDFSSPIYRLELGMVGRFFAQDAPLYASIISATPERRAILKDFIASVADNRELLEEGNTEKFVHEFKSVAAWFGPFCDQSIRESTFLIEKLVERF